MEEEAEEENQRDSTVASVWPDHADFKNRERGRGAKEGRRPPEAGKGKEMDPSLKLPEEIQTCLDFSPVRPHLPSDLQKYKLINFCHFKPLCCSNHKLI